MPSTLWDQITYPFPNFNGCTVEVWEWTSHVDHLILYNECNYLSMLSSRLIRVSERVPLQWHHNGLNSVSNHQPHHCLLSRFFFFFSGVDQRKHQSSAPLAFVWGIYRGPVNSPHKWPVTRKMFPFDDVTMPGIKLTISHHWSTGPTVT